MLLTSSARAFTLGELWVGQYDSFPMGACDDERGWFALRCWTAEIDVNLEAGESGLYVLEWSPDLVTWSELNNNPDIAFPPHASFNGTMNLPGPGTWTMVYPSPPVDVMFLRLKRLGDWVPNLSPNKNLTRKRKPSKVSGMNDTKAILAASVPPSFNGIRPGDRVTLAVHAGIGRNGPETKPKSGRCVMAFESHVVVNLGGRFGTPGVCTADNYINHKPGKA